jgi:hypothetical protein
MLGCASTNPIEARRDVDVIEFARANADGTIRFVGFGNWYANFKGFSLLHPLPPFTPGVISITDRGVALTTRVRSVIGMRHVPLEQVESVELASFGANRRIVLCKKNLHCDSFDFTRSDSDFVDAAKVEQAAAYLRDAVVQIQRRHAL